ncbi:FixH family protein [Sphingomonas psychrotolerans]|uniref:Nitrogen fixation protein FixH n=1 Tax=Sphingomonas psychrotolerans TaxID=1327635 RepID=A0A2K8MQ38_9SPHN|nr:FixH family protein [Sphingomonas psychrotolerans]ATY33561.1 nitrogen fixation protein FixH [Sphingomonas psychrotolerans]
MTRPFRFTGWHMLAAMVAFFGVVVSVNVTMATLATRTFGGVVVANSYVASQKFNGWLAEAKAQDRLGWTIAARSVDRRPVLEGNAGSGALAEARITAVARHPLGRAPEIRLRFLEVEPGHYVAQTRLPAGRWRLHLRVARDHQHADLIKDVTA